jgi:hypothetical protein
MSKLGEQREGGVFIFTFFEGGRGKMEILNESPECMTLKLGSGN